MNTRITVFALSAIAVWAGLGAGQVTAQDQGWDTSGFVENATYYRDEPGLSKFRNTGQFEFSKDFGKRMGLSNFRISGTLRATYDGVYDLNDDEFGDKAGGPRNFENLGGATAPNMPLPTTTDGTSPWGASFLGNGGRAGGGTIPPGFAFNHDDPTMPLHNPNEGLKVLGEDFHQPGGGGNDGGACAPL